MNQLLYIFLLSLCLNMAACHKQLRITVVGNENSFLNEKDIAQIVKKSARTYGKDSLWMSFAPLIVSESNGLYEYQIKYRLVSGQAQYPLLKCGNEMICGDRIPIGKLRRFLAKNAECFSNFSEKEMNQITERTLKGLMFYGRGL